ncbi:MAG: hypothetical protein AB7S26_16580 [Sandaracinaceae bacterium]
MPSLAIAMDAKLEATLAPAPTRSRVPTWDGSLSVWVAAARAAAPWPAWALLAMFAMPGEHASPWLGGPFALSMLVAAMVLVAHRPPRRAAWRWISATLGTGLLLEIASVAVTDMGRREGLAGLAEPARMLSTWLAAVAVYEVAPIVAASSRVSAHEHRSRSLDVVAHAGFVLLALASRMAPTYGELWAGSPWLGAFVAAPLAAARCGQLGTLNAAVPRVRAPVPWMLAAIVWGIAIVVAIGSRGAIAESLHGMRWGLTPSRAVMLASSSLAILLSLATAAWFAWRGMQVRGAPSGKVASKDERTLTLDLDDGDEPVRIKLGDALDTGDYPAVGARVTLLGTTKDRAGKGPFRDGRDAWRAHGAWGGAPDELSRTLWQRAGEWTAWAGSSAIGLVMLLG